MKSKKITLDKLLIANRRKTVLLVISLVGLSVFAPLKSFVMQWLVNSSNKKEVFMNFLLGMAVVLASHFFEYVSRNTFNIMNTQAISAARCRLLDRLTHMPLRQYLAEQSENWQAAMTNDLRMIEEDYYAALFQMAMWGGMGVIAVIYMAMISPVLLLISLLLSALPFLAPKLLASFLSKTKDAYAKTYNRYCAKVSEFLHGYESLLLNKRRAFLGESINALSDENISCDDQMKQGITVSAIVTSLISWIPGFVVLVVSAFLMIDGTISFGYLVTANSLINFIISPFRLVTSAYISVKSSKAIQNNINQLMNCNIAQDGEKTIDRVDHISIQNLSFAYPGSGQNVLNDIWMEISKGSKIAVVGTSGSGKTTLLKLIGKFDSTYCGTIDINQTELRQVNDNAYFDQVAYILQEPFLFEATLRENICLGVDYPDGQLTRAIEMAGLSEMIAHLPAGLDTMITGQGGNVSGGQKKRIAIARALIRGCETLLIDEVTSSLDIETTSEIVRMLLSLPCTVIIVTHDLFDSYMDLFDRIYCISNGSIAQQGTYAQLMRQDGVFSRLVQSMNKPKEENHPQSAYEKA